MTRRSFMSARFTYYGSEVGIYIVESDTNLVFSRVAKFYATPVQKLILKCLENSLENQPITPKFVLYCVIVKFLVVHSLGDRYDNVTLIPLVLQLGLRIGPIQHMGAN